MCTEFIKTVDDDGEVEVTASTKRVQQGTTKAQVQASKRKLLVYGVDVREPSAQKAWKIQKV